MTLTQRQIEKLYKMLSRTEAEELTCGDCLKKIAEFAENTLAGKSVPQSLRAIELHLAMCGDCEEEFRALMTVLESDG